MPQGPIGPREYGHYISLAQVGLEMVAPIGLGLVLDHYFNWSPWGVVGGAAFGLVGGLAHLVTLANRPNGSDTPKSRREGPQ
jgi:F0F1-type ATP synthase assembly protein I